MNDSAHRWRYCCAKEPRDVSIDTQCLASRAGVREADFADAAQ